MMKERKPDPNQRVTLTLKVKERVSRILVMKTLGRVDDGSLSELRTKHSVKICMEIESKDERTGG